MYDLLQRIIAGSPPPQMTASKGKQWASTKSTTSTSNEPRAVRAARSKAINPVGPGYDDVADDDSQSENPGTCDTTLGQCFPKACFGK